MTELIHIFFGFSSLLSGTIVLMMKKGNRSHRRLGRVYLASMLGLNITAFGIYKLYGGWGFFHWMAVASLMPLIAGYIAIRFKNIGAHYYFMCWSFIGLICATISEIFVHIPIAVSLLNRIPNTDTIIIVCLIIYGFYILPKLQHRYVNKA